MPVQYKRSNFEKIFLIFFFPIVIIFYLIYKYPLWFVSEEQVANSFYWLGKSTSFWYSTVYTGFVAFICISILIKNKTAYSKNKKKKLSSYQKKKWYSILFSQIIFFYFIPYFFPYFNKWSDFFNDQYAPINKNAYVYVYNGFTSIGGALYIFILVPLSVWYFGKRYCSWFCACGNLAETAGVTSLGAKWVRMLTPRGKTAEKLEIIQIIFLIFAFIFGFILLFDSYKIFVSNNFVMLFRNFQDLVVDLIFGALIGVGAYPILGTRIWCRYGCPLAGLMKLFGKYAKSKFKVVASDACKGIDLCTQVCPMGIDVASFAHKDKKPMQGSFSLTNTPCIGCGGCIDICPVNALSFKY